MSAFQELGLAPVINASATLTKLGGSRMPPPVLAAMQEAAANFIDLHQFQERAGARIAELTRNEAAYVSSGAAAGIVVAVAACIAGTDPDKMAAFPYLDGIEKTEVIISRGQRNGYDYAARQTGARIIETGPTLDDFVAAFSPRTACVLWFAGALSAENSPRIEDAIRETHARGVPFLVDAAAQIPPVKNLWYFTRELGADAVIFSGGKGLCGPQSTGLVLGKPEIIAGCRANGSPNHSLGRPMKVGKEELAGCLAAVEWTLARDEPAIMAEYEGIVAVWIAGLQEYAGVTVTRGYPSEAGQPHGRAIIALEPESGWTRDGLIDALRAGSPRIEVGLLNNQDNAIALNPQTVTPDEAATVLTRLQELLGAPPASA